MNQIGPDRFADPPARLHDLLFDVMSAARDGRALGPMVPELEDALSNTADHVTAEVPKRFELMRALFVIGASLQDREDIRSRFGAWITRHDLHVPAPESTDPITLSWRNNHVLLQAAMLSTWPEHDATGATGQALIARFLAGQRADGLFETEICRGASALWYSNLAVMLLTALAIRTPHHVPQETLALAIRGLTAALAAPHMLWRESRMNLYPHPDHGSDPQVFDTRFLSGYYRSRHYLSWVPLAAQVLGNDTVLPRVPAHDRFPLCSDYIGGFAETVLGRVTAPRAAI